MGRNNDSLEREFYRGLLAEARDNPVRYGESIEDTESGLLVDNVRDYAIVLRLVQEEKGFGEEWFQEMYWHEVAHFGRAEKLYGKRNGMSHLGVYYHLGKRGEEYVQCFYEIVNADGVEDLAKKGLIAMAPCDMSSGDVELARRSGVLR